jgi:cellulose synthase/poly-beta-1,6-N-acetylglucosamine synthase-like glycosyltransferase
VDCSYPRASARGFTLCNKNPRTGRKNRSVYTPDLVAVGEGPKSWSEWYGQQTRWSAGTYDAIKHQFWKVVWKLRPGAMLHYFLMLTYYPSVAVGWGVGLAISACYLGFGITGLHTDSGWWLTYYVDIATMQFVLYWFMRKHNVSPHEKKGSSGLSGMVMSALTVPIYARSCIMVWLFGKTPPFAVTNKGDLADPDSLWTFRYSLMWAVVPVAILAAAVHYHRNYALMIAWVAVILVICVAPVVMWRYDKVVASLSRRRARRQGQHRVTATTEKILTDSRK